MAAKSSERVQQLKQQFMTLHKQGLSTAEIAKHFNVTTRCIYYNLQEIADSNNVSREELLARPHKQHAPRNCRVLKSCEEVDPIQLTENFENMIQNANNIVSKIDTILASEQEEN